MAGVAKEPKAGPSGSRKAAAARKPKAAAKEDAPVKADDGATMKLRDLVAAAADRAVAKKATARPVIDAALALIGEALDRGEVLNLPPLGKVRVGRARDAAKGSMLTVKLKRPGGKAKAPLADSGEDD